MSGKIKFGIRYLKVPADPEKPMELMILNGIEELRENIGGGYIEAVTLRQNQHCPGARLYCDEEFQYKRELGVNFRASLMAQLGGVFPKPDQVIGGDVLLFDGYHGDKEAPVTDKTVQWAYGLEELLKKLEVI
ncbi:hypothetical protein SEA_DANIELLEIGNACE_46 [Arthrobacter phage DanielleIgnace]|nr:hypothetical protein SEA_DANIELLEIGNACE_46 [Arthrobacter phage DanielleIgnace]